MAAPALVALTGHAAFAGLLLLPAPRRLPLPADPPAIQIALAAAAPTAEAGPAATAAELPAPEPPPVEPPPATAPEPPPLAATAPPSAPPARPPVRPVARPVARAVPPAPAPGTASPQAAVAAEPASPSPGAVDSWRAALSDWINRNRTYPQAARLQGEEGEVRVRFVVDADGQVLEAALVRESGVRALDTAAIALLRGARVPAPPPGLDPAGRQVTVAIRYQLR